MDIDRVTFDENCWNKTKIGEVCTDFTKLVSAVYLTMQKIINLFVAIVSQFSKRKRNINLSMELHQASKLFKNDGVIYFQGTIRIDIIESSKGCC